MPPYVTDAAAEVDSIQQEPVADLGFRLGSSVYVTNRIKRAKFVLGGVDCGKHVPPGKFSVPFWGETARVGRSTAKASRCVWSL